MLKVNIRTVNIVTIMVAALFFLSTLLVGYSEATYHNSFMANYNNLIQEFNFINSQAENGPEVEVNEDSRLFETPVSAFLSAYYDSYINAESYHVVSYGVTTFETINLPIKVTIVTQTKNRMIKYRDGSTIYELIMFEPGNTYGRTGARIIFYSTEFDMVFIIMTGTVRSHRGDLIPDYSGSKWYFVTPEEFVEIAGIVPGESVYNFRTKEPNNTFRVNVEATYYRETIDRRTGDIREYAVEVDARRSLHLAGTSYRRVIKFIAETPGYPTIEKMTAGARINSEGEITHLLIQDTYTIETFVSNFNISMRIRAINSAVYQFIQIGGEIEYEAPYIVEAFPLLG